MECALHLARSPRQGLLSMTSSFDAMKAKLRNSRMVQEAAAQNPEVRRTSGGALQLRGQAIHVCRSCAHRVTTFAGTHTFPALCCGVLHLRQGSR